MYRSVLVAHRPRGKSLYGLNYAIHRYGSVVTNWVTNRTRGLRKKVAETRGSRPSPILILAAALGSLIAGCRATASPIYGGPSTRTSSAVARPMSDVLVVDCVGDPAQREPAIIILACGDGNIQAIQLRWLSWQNTEAKAIGYVNANNCDPSCVAGHFEEYAASFTLSRVERAGEQVYFTLVVVTYRNKEAFGRRTESYQLLTPRGG